MRGIDPGRYRHRVCIEEQVELQDSETLEITVTWLPVTLDTNTVLRSVPAEVLTGPGREAVRSGGKYAEATARINMRWFPGLLPSMRVVWDGRTFDILGIETDATARREYRLACRDGLTDGR